MFNDNNNYFVLTDTNKEPIVIKCAGESDWHFNDNMKFDELLIIIMHGVTAT
jgi:hypothetical protein